jgi:hypothetical protein
MTMKRTKTRQRFALCLDNREYPASLERWKIYQVLPDADAESHGQVRVVDESGEDYLYPSDYFKPLRLSPSLVRLFPQGVRVKSRRPAAIRTA